jgi:hypothetical protein
MRKLVFVLAFVLVLGLAVPASAASWRGYASVRSDRGITALAAGAANNTKDIQIGVYTYGTGRAVQWEATFWCEKGSTSVSRTKSGTVTTSARTWKWINVRANASLMDFCDVTALATPSAGAVRLKIRVRS